MDCLNDLPRLQQQLLSFASVFAFVDCLSHLFAFQMHLSLLCSVMAVKANFRPKLVHMVLLRSSSLCCHSEN